MEQIGDTIIIPRHLVTVRFIDVPSLEPQEIGQMAVFQAVKEIPYSKEEIIVSYKNLSSFKEGFSSIMLVIAKRQMIQEKLRNSESKGLKVESIRLESEIVPLFLLKQGSLRQDKVNLIIHIGKFGSEIMVIDKTRPIFSRGFENNEAFLDEINRSILVYERAKASPEIENIIVAYAAGKDIEKVKSFLKEHFVIPVSFSGYGEGLSAIGFSLEINLLPKEITKRKEKLQKKYENIVTYSLLGFAIILFFTFIYFKIYEKNKFLAALSSRMNEMKLQIGPLDEFLKKTELAKKHNKEGNFIINILKNAYSMIPVNISIEGLDYDGKGSISYKGIADDTQGFFSFVKTLEQSKCFDKVEVKYATKKKVENKELTDFNINCQISMKNFGIQ